MSEAAAPIRLPHPLLLGLVVLIAMGIGGTMALWAHYGSMVFFEMIRTGFVACFG
jgi:hypothetical protein